MLDALLGPKRGGGNRGTAKLAGDNGRSAIGKVTMYISHMARVRVAANHQGVARVAGGDAVDQAGARGRVAVPAVGPPCHAIFQRATPWREHGGLCEHIPLRAGAFETLRKPAFLLRPQLGARRVETLWALRIGHCVGAAAHRLGARLRTAILPCIDHVKARQRAEIDCAINHRFMRARQHAFGERHVLVVCLVCRCAPREEIGHQVFCLIVGVVVVYLVVVPRHDPRRARVGGLQISIQLVVRVTLAIVGERECRAFAVVRARAYWRVVGTGAHGARAAFVNVVTQKNDQIQILRRHVAIGREIAGFIVLAGGKGKAQARRRALAARQGAGAPHRAGEVAAVKAIPIVLLRRQPD